MKALIAILATISALCFGAMIIIVAVSWTSGCTRTDKQHALDEFNALAGQVCVEHDSWGVCLAKCKAACANPSATPAPSSSASGAAP